MFELLELVVGVIILVAFLYWLNNELKDDYDGDDSEQSEKSDPTI